jgi:hypothetical protein
LKQAKEYLDRPGVVSKPVIELEEGIYPYSELGKLANQVYIPTKKQIKLINYNPLPSIKAELSVGK